VSAHLLACFALFIYFSVKIIIIIFFAESFMKLPRLPFLLHWNFKIDLLAHTAFSIAIATLGFPFDFFHNIGVVICYLPEFIDSWPDFFHFFYFSSVSFLSNQASLSFCLAIFLYTIQNNIYQ
jgi:hypothetical protein